MATRGGPKVSRLRPCSVWKKLGSQNRKNHQIGSIMNLPTA
jgi:hypothetical protein